MEAMRHRDMKLTMRTYTDPTVLDVAGALERLPDLREESPEASAAAAGVLVTRIVTYADGSEGHSESMSGTSAPTTPTNTADEATPVTANNDRGIQSVAPNDPQKKKWRPQRDLNPCRQRERLVS